jgi:uncharacterized protein (TIGR00290 family)
MSPRRAVVSWSSGKDCALALIAARRANVEVTGLLSTVSQVHDRVSIHGTRRTLLRRQAEALGLPLIEVPLPDPCPNAVYEARTDAALPAIRATGAEALVFGDLFLADVRAYREARLDGTGLAALFPLWGQPTEGLARQILAEGIAAHVVAVDLARLPAHFAGRAYDEGLLAELPEGIDPCGENGEFHTAVTGHPMFAAPVAVRAGETVLRDGFAYADLIPV